LAHHPLIFIFFIIQISNSLLYVSPYPYPKLRRKQRKLWLYDPNLDTSYEIWLKTQQKTLKRYYWKYRTFKKI